MHRPAWASAKEMAWPNHGGRGANPLATEHGQAAATVEAMEETTMRMGMGHRPFNAWSLPHVRPQVARPSERTAMLGWILGSGWKCHGCSAERLPMEQAVRLAQRTWTVQKAEQKPCSSGQNPWRKHSGCRGGSQALA